MKAWLAACLLLLGAASAFGAEPLEPADLAQRGDYAQAIQGLRAKLPNATPAAQVALWLQLADYQRHTTHSQDVLNTLQQALGVAQQHQLSQEIARVTFELADFYYRAGDYPAALTQVQQAQAHYEKLKATGPLPPNALARTLMLRGRIHTDLGQGEQAIQWCGQAMAQWDHANEKAFVGDQMIAMGEASFLRGGFTAKQVYLQMALEYGNAPLQKIKALSELSHMYFIWGKLDQSQLHLQEAIALAQAADPALARQLRLQQGELYQAQQKPDLARQSFQQVEQALANETNRFVQGQTYLRLGESLRMLGDRPQAQRYYEKAQTHFQALNIPFQEAKSVYGLAELARQQKAYNQAIPLYQQVLQLVQGNKDPVYSAFYYGGLGQSLLALGQTPAAIAELEKAVALAEEMYNHTVREARLEFFERLLPLYQSLVRAYFRAGRIDDALDMLEEHQSLMFNERLNHRESARKATTPQAVEAPYDWGDGLKPDSLMLVYHAPESEAMLQFRIQLNQDPISSRWQAKAREGLELTHQAQIEAHPLYLKYASALRFKADQPLLPQICQAYYRLLSNPQADAEHLKALGQILYQLLIAPHESALQGKTTLLIAPEGELALIPFETLVMPDGRYLLERFHIQYLPSVKTLRKLSQRLYSADRKPMLVVGNPVYEPVDYTRDPVESPQQLLALKREIWKYPDAPMREMYGALYGPQWVALPGAAQEVAALQKSVPETALLTGEQATEAQIKAQAADLGRYRVLHFATHGIAVPEIPELSALVLAQMNHDPSEDGYLRVPEIMDLKLQADFVNLSACETGLGKIFRGEGMVGLSQAFLTAGANQISVALWQINDDSSSQLMGALYQQAQGNYAASLQQVKRQFIAGVFGDKYRHPYYWSPFIVYGKLDS